MSGNQMMCLELTQHITLPDVLELWVCETSILSSPAESDHLCEVVLSDVQNLKSVSCRMCPIQLLQHITGILPKV